MTEPARGSAHESQCARTSEDEAEHESDRTTAPWYDREPREVLVTKLVAAGILLVVAPFAAFAACGGTTVGSDDAGADATSSNDGGVNADGAPDFDACGPGVVPIPTQPIYDCDAEAPDGGGCAGYAPNKNRTYPIGCRAYLPTQQGGCAGECCGAQECTCQSGFMPNGAPTFECPL